MKKRLNDFANDGFGWYCLQCSAGQKKSKQASRLMTEGEAESKEPALSDSALAKWADTQKTVLKCARCGTTESIRD